MPLQFMGLPIAEAMDIISKHYLAKDDRVPVYDNNSGARLLGSLSRPGLKPQLTLKLHIRNRRPVRFYRDEYSDPDYYPPNLSDYLPPKASETVEFTFAYRRDPLGWNMTGVYLTSAPLSKLMLLPEFRLPGETRAEAAERRKQSLN